MVKFKLMFYQHNSVYIWADFRQYILVDKMRAMQEMKLDLQ